MAKKNNPKKNREKRSRENLDNLNFDSVERLEKVFKLGKHGTHVIKEFMGNAGNEYRKRFYGSVEVSNDGKISSNNLTRFSDEDSYLVSICLYKREEDGDKSVSVDWIVENLTDQVIKKISLACREINGMSKGEEDKDGESEEDPTQAESAD